MTKCDFRSLGVLGAAGALACGPMQPVVVHGRVVVTGSVGTNLACAAGGLLVAGLVAYLAPTRWWLSAVLVLLSVPFIRRAVTGIRAARGHVAASVIVVDDAGVTIDGRLEPRRHAIKSVDWSPSGTRAPATVRIVDRWRILNIACSSDADADAIVKALRFAPDERTASFAFIGGERRKVVLTVAAAGLVPAVLVPFARHIDPTAILVATIVFGLAPGLVLALDGVRVDVGLDGLRISRWWRAERFVPYDAKVMSSACASSPPRRLRSTSEASSKRSSPSTRWKRIPRIAPRCDG